MSDTPFALAGKQQAQYPVSMDSESLEKEKFLQLPEEEQKLVLLLAIHHAPINISTLHRLSDAGTTKILRRKLAELASCGWVYIQKQAGTQYICMPGHRGSLVRHALQENKFPTLAKQITWELSPRFPAKPKSGQSIWKNPELALRDLQIAALLAYVEESGSGEEWGAMEEVSKILDCISAQWVNHRPNSLKFPWKTLWGDVLDAAWFPFLPTPLLMQWVVNDYLELFGEEITNQQPFWELCQQRLQELAPIEQEFVWGSNGLLLYWQFFLRGTCDKLPKLARPMTVSKMETGPFGQQWHIYHQLFEAVCALGKGKLQEASDLYRAALAKIQILHDDRDLLFGDMLELLGILAWLLEEKGEYSEEANRTVQHLLQGEPAYFFLSYFMAAQEDNSIPSVPNDPELYGLSPLMPMFGLLIMHWLRQEIPEILLKYAKTFREQAQQAGYNWLSGEYAALLAHLLPDNDPKKTHYTALSKSHHEAAGTVPLITLYQPQAAWERTLSALQQLGQQKTTKTTKPKQAATEGRVVWLLKKKTEQAGKQQWHSYSLQPKLQKRTKKGGWTAGRNIALKRLKEEPETIDGLSDEDRPLCGAIAHNSHYGYYYYDDGAEYELDMEAAWSALIGYPRLFWDDARNTPIEVQKGREELLILKKGDQIQICLHPAFDLDGPNVHDKHLIIEETPIKLRVYPLTPDLLQLNHILGESGLLVPAEAEENLRKTLENLAPMITIQSDIAGMDNAETVESDPRLHLHLLPWSQGLRLLMRIQPFGDNGPAFPPGDGRATVLSEIDGQLQKTTRDLDQERQSAESIIENATALAHWDDPAEECLLDDPEQCLEALSQLQQMSTEPEHQLELSWPEGEKLRLAGLGDFKQLSLKVQTSGDWFEMDGELRVNDQLVLTLRQLIELNRNATGRFLPLEDGQFLTLTQQFQKRLDALQAYAEPAKGGKGKKAKDGKDSGTLKIGTLAGMALEDFIDGAGELEADNQWREQTQRLQQLRESQPVLPDTLQTELRDYQEEGFRWMMRLAEWGVGGCLADDMGLGKTVQTLALLLARAENPSGHPGATLIIAPTSVCHNWQQECQRFAPTLHPVQYRGKERQQLLDGLQPNDLVITSYNLLQQDAEAFQQIHWHTIVLDEAQAIKNTQAKRTQAAYGLQGDFRLATTGTPIENHLGELWSLFRFLNPGLLFSRQQFSDRFMLPIERDQDTKVRQHLKKLVQPFMLRRTKNQVLQELPPRTETTLTVPLSEGEMSLYEAIRQEALSRFDQPGAEENKQLEVLAEITRLRLAACHPKLAMPESTLPSSKLQAFGDLVEELRENNHKALVFSQFVKHLSLIRAWLDEQEISYQYLDGSTPANQRQERVEAFQNGEGEIFLISLKAGGSGLNLTAADYVIHMDPWWNPAVEDQASDRAHRIGQQRPVNIYRLVAENTIEEKIVKLHQQKRDLADSLLEGSDVGGKLSAKEILEMIRDRDETA